MRGRGDSHGARTESEDPGAGARGTICAISPTCRQRRRRPGVHRRRRGRSRLDRNDSRAARRDRRTNRSRARARASRAVRPGAGGSPAKAEMKLETRIPNRRALQAAAGRVHESAQRAREDAVRRRQEGRRVARQSRRWRCGSSISSTGRMLPPTRRWSTHRRNCGPRIAPRWPGATSDTRKAGRAASDDAREGIRQSDRRSREKKGAPLTDTVRDTVRRTLAALPTDEPPGPPHARAAAGRFQPADRDKAAADRAETENASTTRKPDRAEQRRQSSAAKQQAARKEGSRSRKRERTKRKRGRSSEKREREIEKAEQALREAERRLAELKGE